MATKNIPLIIAVPGRGNTPIEITFVASAADGDMFRIPRRYPMADIVPPAGYFRHNVLQNGSNSRETAVSAELGGATGANALTTLGFELPRTEKLILLVKKGTADAETLTIKGSVEYKIDDVVITLPAASGSTGKIYEIDLYDLGLFVGRKANSIVEDGVLIVANTAETLVALVARVA